MEIVIVEDEKPAARSLARKLEKLGYNVKIMLHSVTEAVQWFSLNPNPDLIFLDIQLSDGLSFEIFDQIDISSAIIFTTAYDEYALKAFKLNSIDYLLKPIDPEELSFALLKFQNQQSKNTVSVQVLKQILNASSTSINYKTRYVVKVGQQIKMIELKDVQCFYSENKGTYIKTLDNRNYLSDASLDVIEAEINPLDFFRINRKFIIHRQSIIDIYLYTNSRLKINFKDYKSDDLIVSREKVADFKQWLS